MSTAEKTTADPYEKMSVEQLRAELERLDEVCARQEVQIMQLKEGSLAVIKDLSVCILARIDGNNEAAPAGLDAIINKNVTVVPKAGDLH